MRQTKGLVIRWLGVTAFLFAALFTLGFPQCQTRGGCSPGQTNLMRDLNTRIEVAPAAGEKLMIWIDVIVTGVFSPTLPWPGAQGWLLPANDELVEPIPPFLDDLAKKGYLAIRVPHAPPNYAASQLIPGGAGVPNAVEFTYYSPPDAAQPTTVPISVTRRPDYEAIVNTRYPIADGRSHWEVWWIVGDRFPIPEDTFRLKEDWPQALGVVFQINFGAGAQAEACNECVAEVLVYNGYTFLGPWRQSLAVSLDNCAVANPKLTFDMCEPGASVVQYVDSGVAFTHTHFLGNFEATDRTYIITGASSLGWDYVYYYGQAGQPLQRAAGLPFEVPLGPAPTSHPCASCMIIHAVYTPTMTVDEPVRETLSLTATSKISPSLSANTVSMALGHGYRLNEASPTPTEAPTATPTRTRTPTPVATLAPTETPTPTRSSRRIYLPVVLHAFRASQ